MGRLEIFQGKDGLWYWHEKAGNNKIVETSGEGYKTRWGARMAASKFARQPEHSNLPFFAMLILVLIMALLLWLLWSHASSSPQDTHQTQPTSQPAPAEKPAPVHDTPTPTPKQLPNTGGK